MISVLLCDVRSAYNVGAIFRTADAVGVQKLFLGGISPRPVDRFGRLVPEITKTALGATDSVAWEGVDDVMVCLQKLKTEGVNIVVVEQTPTSIPITSFAPHGSICYVFGNEVTGVPPEVVAIADIAIELPMRGIKESLNVSVTAGVVLYYHTWRVS